MAGNSPLCYNAYHIRTKRISGNIKHSAEGETEYAYYFILYATPKIKESGITFFNNVCESFTENAPEIETASSTESSDTIQWFNNTYAILTVLNTWDYTLYGGQPADETGRGLSQNILQNSWDVTDRASADETLDWILTEGHRVAFAEEMDYLADAGWDYSHAMSLLGFYYLAGYYTETEALDGSLEIAKTLQGKFDSWDALVESYLRGYEYWAEESSDERREIYEDLKKRDDNPYSVDYNTELVKSW